MQSMHYHGLLVKVFAFTVGLDGVEGLFAETELPTTEPIIPKTKTITMITRHPPPHPRDFFAGGDCEI